MVQWNKCFLVYCLVVQDMMTMAVNKIYKGTNKSDSVIFFLNQCQFVTVLKQICSIKRNIKFFKTSTLLASIQMHCQISQEV